MDSRFGALPGVLCCHYGANELRLPPLLGPETPIYRCLLWLHRIDVGVLYQGMSRPRET